MSESNIHLTSSEIGALWADYMKESMSLQVMDFMLQHIGDPEIKHIVQYAHDLSSNHLDTLGTIFEDENYAIPNGFSDQDVNMNAPWLFTDIFCLTYVNHMTRLEMTAYSGFLAVSYR